jgi:ribosome-binding factor A
MSPDLKLATIYVLPLGGKDVNEVIEALDKHKKFLRTDIARRVNLKFAPDIRFRNDAGFDASAKIDAILNSPKVKQDLEQKGDEEGSA